MKKTQCIKCGSGNTYQQDGENACMMCGSRWPIVLEPTQATVKETAAEQMEETDSAKNSRKKACRNCGRIMTIPGDGLCGGCYGAVHNKFTKGTPEYDAALEKAKIKLTDPNFKTGNNRSKKISKIVMPPLFPRLDSSLCVAEIAIVKQGKTLPPPPLNQQSSKEVSPISAAIAHLKDQVHKNEEKQAKMRQAIEILSEL